MACKITYKGKRFDSVKDYREFLDTVNERELKTTEDVASFGELFNFYKEVNQTHIKDVDIIRQNQVVKNVVSEVTKELMLSDGAIDIIPVIRGYKSKFSTYAQMLNVEMKRETTPLAKKQQLHSKLKEIAKLLNAWDRVENFVITRLQNTSGIKIKATKKVNILPREVYEQHTSELIQNQTKEILDLNELKLKGKEYNKRFSEIQAHYDNMREELEKRAPSKKYNIEGEEDIVEEPNQTIEEGDADFEKKRYDSMVGEVDPKSSASPLLKLYLSTISKRDKDGNLIKSWYGTNEMEEFDIVWSYLKENLANEWSNRKQIIKKLNDKTRKKEHPFLYDIVELFQLKNNEESREKIKQRLIDEKVNDETFVLKFNGNSWNERRNNALEAATEFAEANKNKILNKELQLARQLLVQLRSNAINMKMIMQYSNMDGNRNTMSKLVMLDANRNRISQKIREDWMINLKKLKHGGVPMYNYVDGQHIPNKEVIRIYFDSFRERYHPMMNNEQKADLLFEFLEGLGIDMPTEYQDRFYENYKAPIYINGKKYTPGDVLKNLFLNEATGLQNKFETDLSLEKSNPLNDGYIKSLSGTAAQFNNKFRPEGFMVNGKSVYEYTTTQFNADQLRELQTNTDLVKDLMESTFSTNSHWLESSYLKNAQGWVIDDRGRPKTQDLGGFKKMEFFTMSLDPFREDWDKRKHLSMEKRDELTNERYRIGAFMKGVPDKATFGHSTMTDVLQPRSIAVTYPTSSNKKRITGFDNVPGFITTFKPKTLSVTDTVINKAYEQLVEPEINRILEVQDAAEHGDSLLKSYGFGARLFHFIPELNNIKELFDETGELKEDILTNPKLRVLINDAISNHIIKKGLQKYKFWSETGIGISVERDTKSGTSVTDHFKNLDANYMYKVQAVGLHSSAEERDLAVKRAAIDMEFNNMIANANMYMLFIGDPAQYFKPNATKPLFKNGVFTTKSEADFIRAFHDDNQYGGTPEQNKKQGDINRVKLIKDTFDNAGKRLAADIAPGWEMADTRTEDYTFKGESLDINYMFLNDVEVGTEPLGLDFLREIGLNEDAIKKYAEKIQGADGQEYVHWSEHLRVLLHQGDIDDATHDEIYEKLKNGQELTPHELKGIFQPQKPVYAANRMTHTHKGINSKSMIRLYVKTSAFPLIPQVTKTMEIHKLTEFLEKRFKDENLRTIHRVPMMSGTKVGGVASSVKAMNETKTWNKLVDSIEELEDGEDGIVVDDTQQVITVKRQGFRIQQSVPFKEDKDEINRVSQAAKLKLIDMLDFEGFGLSTSLFTKQIANLDFGIDISKREFTGRELNDLYDNIFLYMYETDQNAFNKKFRNGDKWNMPVLREALIDEAIARKYPPTMIEAIAMHEDLSFIKFSPYALQFQSLFNSFVNNRIIKKTMPGYSYVLGSEEGMRLQEGLTEKDLNNKSIIWTQFFNGKSLQPTRYFTIEEATDEEIKEAAENKRLDGKYILDANGKRIIRGDQVLVRPKIQVNTKNGVETIDWMEMKDGKYVYLNDEGGRLTLKTSKLSKQSLEMFGMRIPNQGPNSTAYIEIAGFLPDSSGDLMIAPRDFTVRMGSDFDVDKLYTYQYNLSFNKRGKIVPYNGKDTKKLLKNVLVDIHMQVSKNPDPKVQRLIATPLDEWELVGISNDILELREDRFNSDELFSGITSEYQRTKYNNARAGQIGVGVFSQDSVFNAIAQGFDLSFVKRRKKGPDVPLNEYFGDNRSNNISDVRTSDYSVSRLNKSQIIQAWQSASVDDEALQILYKINANDITMPAIRYMNQVGFTKETPYFIAQDSIVEYVQLIKRGKKAAKAKEMIFEKYNIELPTDPAEINEYKTKYNEIANRLSHEALRDLIKNGESVEGYQEAQAALFLRFLEFVQRGEILGDLQKKLGRDTKNVGKNLIETFELTKEDDTPTGVKIKNEDDILNKSVPGWVFRNALPTAQLFDSIFQTQAPFIESTFEYISSAVRRNVSIDVKEAIYKDIISYLYAHPEFGFYEGEVREARQRMFKSKLLNVDSIINENIEQSIRALRGLPEDDYPIFNSYSIGVTPNKDVLFFDSTRNKYIVSATASFADLRDFVSNRGGFQLEDSQITFLKNILGSNQENLRKYILYARVIADMNNSAEITPEHFKEVATKIRDERFDSFSKSNLSMTEILQKLKGPLFNNNSFLNALTLNVSEDIDRIEFTASLGKLLNEQIYSEAFLNLFTSPEQPVLGIYNGIEFTPKRLGIELIKYAMLSGGQQGAIDFVKYIPPSVFYRLPLTSTNRTIGDLITSLDLYDSAFFSNFKYQFLQHHSDELYSLKAQVLFGVKALPEKIEKEKIDFTKFDIKDEEGNTFVPHAFVAKIKDKQAIYINDGKNTYHKVDILGADKIKEYDPIHMFGKSTFNSAGGTYKIEETGLSFVDEIVMRRLVNKDDPSVYKSIIENSFLDPKIETDLPTMLNDMMQRTTDPYQKSLLRAYYEYSINKPIKFTVKSEPLEINGVYHTTYYRNGSINIAPQDVKTLSQMMGSTTQAFNLLVLHELSHAFSIRFINQNWNNDVAEIEDLKNIYDLFLDQVANDPSFLEDKNSMLKNLNIDNRMIASRDRDDNAYKVGLNEFVAQAMSNHAFQSYLATIESSGTFIDKFMNALKNLVRRLLSNLNIDYEGTLLEDAIASIVEIQTLDVDISPNRINIDDTAAFSTNAAVYKDEKGIYYRFIYNDQGEIIGYEKGKSAIDLKPPVSRKGQSLINHAKKLYNKLKNTELVAITDTDTQSMNDGVKAWSTNEIVNVLKTGNAHPELGQLIYQNGIVDHALNPDGTRSETFDELIAMHNTHDEAIADYAKMLKNQTAWGKIQRKVLEYKKSNKNINLAAFATKEEEKPEQFILDSYKRRRIFMERNLNTLSKELSRTKDEYEKNIIRHKMKKLEDAIFNLMGKRAKNLVAGNSEKRLMVEWNSDNKIINAILTSEDPSLYELQVVNEILNFWDIMMDFEQDHHPFLSDETLQAKKDLGAARKALLDQRTDALDPVAGTAMWVQALENEINMNYATYKTMLRNKYKDKLEQSVLDKYQEELSWSDMIVNPSTIQDKFSEVLLDISDTDNPLFQMLHEQYKKVTFRGKQESNQIVEDIDEQLNELRQWVKQTNIEGIETLEDAFNFFRQQYATVDLVDGEKVRRQTGDMIELTSPEWSDNYAYRLNSSMGPGTHEQTENRESKRFHQSKGWERNNVFVLPLLLYQNQADQIIATMLGAPQKDLLKESSINAFLATKSDAEIKAATDVLKKYRKRASELRKKYLEDREFEISYLNSIPNEQIPSHVSKKKYIALKMQKWEYENSPDAYYMATIQGHQAVMEEYGIDEIREELATETFPIINGKYSVAIPNKAEAYDSKFLEMYKEGNEPLLKMYEFTTELMGKLNSFLPDYKVRKIKENGIPFILEDSLQWNGEFVQNLRDKWRKELREDSITDDSSQSYLIDPKTGDPIDEIRTKYIRGTKAVSDYVNVQVSKWVAENADKEITNEYLEEKREVARRAKREIRDQIAQKQTFDLGRTLKAYSIFAYNYHWKATMEEYIHATKYVLSNVDRIADIEGNENINKKDVIENKRRLENMFNVFAETFFNMSAKKEGVVKGKNPSEELGLTTLTKAEQEEYKDAQDAIDKLEAAIAKFKEEKKEDNITETKQKELDGKIIDFTGRIEKLKQIQNRLGGNLAASAYGDKLILLTRLKGMAWNLKAAIVNVLHGLATIYAQAADGRFMNIRNVDEAFFVALNSVGRNLSFNSEWGSTETAMKIRKLMENLDILKESKYEIFTKSKEDTTDSKGKWFSGRLFKGVKDPYSVQARTEYFIQAVEAIAIAKSIKVKRGDEIISYWDAIDGNTHLQPGDVVIRSGEDAGGERPDVVVKLVEDMNIEDIDVQFEQQFAVKLMMDNLIKEDQGNYDPESPALFKRKFWGRLFGLFNTWLTKALHQRFAKKWTDRQLGIEKKGTFLSSIQIPMLPIAILPTFGKMAEEKTREMSWGEQFIQGNAYYGASLLRAIPSRIPGLRDASWIKNVKTLEERGFDKLDAANWRRNISYAQSQLMLIAIYFILAGLSDDEKEERELMGIPASQMGSKEQWSNFFANSAVRIAKDLGTISSPLSLVKQPKEHMSYLSLINQTSKLMYNTGHMIAGTWNEDSRRKARYQQGPFDDQLKPLINLIDIMPGLGVTTSTMRQAHKTPRGVYAEYFAPSLF